MARTQIYAEGAITAPGETTANFVARANFGESVGRDYGKIVWTGAFAGNLILDMTVDPADALSQITNIPVATWTHTPDAQMITFDIAAGATYRVRAAANFVGNISVLIFSGREV